MRPPPADSPSQPEPTPSLGVLLGLMAVCLAVALALGTVYDAMPSDTETAWQSALGFNGIVAFAAVLLHRRSGSLRQLSGVGPRWAYAPALVILAGAALLAGVSRIAGGAVSREVPSVHLAWIFIVPIVEEWAFRAGLGQGFRRLGGAVWGAWFSALTFALAHAGLTVSAVAAGRIGLPLGPFLLGLACEALLAKTGRILPGIALHAACNATVVIFALGDARWLDWLRHLYIG